MSEKRVCVIGAGPSGLAAIKTCIENGLKPVCYDKTPDIGGLWRYRPENVDGVSSVMKTTIINTSKEINAFSDFPPPDHFPNYMHNSLLLEYLIKYAEKFDLVRHINFNCSVVQVSKTKDHRSTGRWDVQVKHKDGQTINETFDAVMVCSGHHVYPNMPKFPGLETFKGRVIHTHDLKSGSGFEDQNALVIGIGNSGVDAAVELSRVTKQVYLSTRKGCWIISRGDPIGMPGDLTMFNRLRRTINSFLPFNVMNTLMEWAANRRFDHSLYGLKPAHRITQQHPTLSDDLPTRMLAGTVLLKGDVEYFTENGVRFKDGKEVYDIDVVIMATGYEIKLPFLSSDIVSAKNNEVPLYKYVFPPTDELPSLAIIGLIQPVGSILPVSEIQARWVAAVFTGQCKLPSSSVMLSDISAKRQAMQQRYVVSPRHTIQVDYIDFMDEIAELVGVKPNFLKLLLTDLSLFKEVAFGVNYAYNYRLHGPHSWPGAADAILNAKKRILKPLKTRQFSSKNENCFLTQLISPFWSVIIVLCFVLLITILK